MSGLEVQGEEEAVEAVGGEVRHPGETRLGLGQRRRGRQTAGEEEEAED